MIYWRPMIAGVVIAGFGISMIIANSDNNRMRNMWITAGIILGIVIIAGGIAIIRKISSG